MARDNTSEERGDYSNVALDICSCSTPVSAIACIISYFWVTSLLSRVRPGLYLDDLYFSSLNETLDFNKTTTIHFDLKIKNKNNLIGLYYEDPVNLTFTYISATDITTNPNLTITKYTIPGFYQGKRKVKHVQDFVVMTHGFLMGPAKVLVFKVDLDLKIKFRSIEKKKCDLVAEALVLVNADTGKIIRKKLVELEYASGTDKWGYVQWLIFIPMYTLLVVVIILILNSIIYNSLTTT